MSPRAQGEDEANHRLGAARPPSVGDQMEDGERWPLHGRFPG
jgi:hypothetical protein